jgi:hypothetical protein
MSSPSRLIRRARNRAPWMQRGNLILFGDVNNAVREAAPNRVSNQTSRCPHLCLRRRRIQPFQRLFAKVAIQVVTV